MTLKEFEKFKENDNFVLVDFYATWCMPCKMQSQVLEDLKQKNVDKLQIEKIDVDESEELVNEFKIVSVPTLIMLKKGEVVARRSGLISEDEIISWMK